jgi:hypothetical protein
MEVPRMQRTLEATINPKGQVTLKEKIRLSRSYRAVVTIFDAEEAEEDAQACETALLSEQALADDWNRQEEDEAWSHLQQER